MKNIKPVVRRKGLEMGLSTSHVFRSRLPFGSLFVGRQGRPYRSVKPLAGYDCLIRKAVLSDRAGLFPLLKDFSTSFSPEETAFDIALENILSDDSAILLVALLENCIIGYCLGFDHYAFYANGRVSWVEELMVHGAFRKKDIGRALMDQFEAWAKSRKSKLVGLATRRAAPFYQALDYENSAVFFRKLL